MDGDIRTSLSPELLNLITEFWVQEINAKTMSGCTYAFFNRNNPEDMKKYEHYRHIQAVAMKQESHGKEISPDDIIREQELSNGYVIDMSLSLAKAMLAETSRGVLAAHPDSPFTLEELLGDPDQYIKRDIVALARYIKQQFDAGHRAVEVALFNRTEASELRVSGMSKGRAVMIVYPTFKVRHWDLSLLNKKMLMEAGIRISSVRPCEILPNGDAAAFVLYLEPYNQES